MNNKGRLLILDDESDVGATICMMAAAADYDADHTDNADIFLEKVAAWKPTHVAVDLQLADRDGIEIIHRLTAMGCGAAVIIISGLGGRILDSAARTATENGLRVAGSLAKPFSRADLQAVLVADIHKASPGSTVPAMPPVSISEQQLAAAIESGAFSVHFQPKVSCINGKLRGFECLARWPQQSGGMIPPDQFIGLAEQTGLIHQLTRHIFQYALANRPAQVDKAGLKFALNLSPINLNDDTFPGWLLNQCRRHHIDPSQIILEVTETASMDDPLTLLANLTQFRIQGFHLSIDDFGVGYSSLVQLARLPFSELKIDRMFVGSLIESTESQKIVTALIGMGQSLGLNVVAEGVEDAWALNFLQRTGCDEAQGYFIASPMTEQAAAVWPGFSLKTIA